MTCAPYVISASVALDDGGDIFPDPGWRPGARVRSGAGLSRLAALFRIMASARLRRRPADAIRRRAVQSNADVDGVLEPSARRHGGFPDCRHCGLGVASP